MADASATSRVDLVAAPDELLDMEIRGEMLRKASSPQFAFVNFPKIRRPENYVRGILFNRSSAMRDQLQWQSSVIPKSLLDDDSLSIHSSRVHRFLLRFMGDKFNLLGFMDYTRATTAMNIISYTHLPDAYHRCTVSQQRFYAIIKDEIYLQLCKQLTHNPRLKSRLRGWQLMCIFLGSFLPSCELELYLVNFINGSMHTHDIDERNYARYSLRRLEGFAVAGSYGRFRKVADIVDYCQQLPFLVANLGFYDDANASFGPAPASSSPPPRSEHLLTCDPNLDRLTTRFGPIVRKQTAGPMETDTGASVVTENPAGSVLAQW